MAHTIRAELARILLEEVSDPALRESSIHEVILSKDLKHAKVFFGIPEGATANKSAEGFQRAQAFFKKKLADNLKLRYVPSLEFERDVHTDSVNRLYDLFEEVRAHE
jgi:ribosome-binding factor A